MSTKKVRKPAPKKPPVKKPRPKKPQTLGQRRAALIGERAAGKELLEQKRAEVRQLEKNLDANAGAIQILGLMMEEENAKEEV